MTGEWNCREFEDALSEFRDGTLTPDAASRARRHLLHCAACSHLIERVGVTAEYLTELKDAEPPSRLHASILSLTVSSHPRTRSFGWIADLAKPRLVTGLAMSVFFVAFLINTADINLRTLSLRQFSASHIAEAMQRNAERTLARGQAYYNDLRVVYEIEAALHEFRHESPEPAMTPAGHSDLEIHHELSISS